MSFSLKNPNFQLACLHIGGFTLIYEIATASLTRFDHVAASFFFFWKLQFFIPYVAMNPDFLHMRFTSATFPALIYSTLALLITSFSIPFELFILKRNQT